MIKWHTFSQRIQQLCSKPDRHRIHRREENILFWKQLLKNPRHLGAIAPSSRALGHFISRHLNAEPNDWIVEIGAGTGRLTQALLNKGISPDRLIVIELDKELVHFLRAHFPQVMIIQGDASELESILPLHVQGQITTIVSGIPLVSIPPSVRDRLITSCFQVLKTNGRLLQFTYSPISPISAKKLGLKKICLGRILLNIPPAVIWAYEKE